MAEELKLKLPEKKKEKQEPAKAVLILLALILFFLIANLTVTSWVKHEAVPGISLQPSKLKDLAVKLEQEDLKAGAVTTWKEYAALPDLGAEEKAKIWYRIGSIEQERGRFEEALDAYYRSEAHASLKEISAEISRKVQECLERSGKFASLRHELDERTSADAQPPKPGAVIVAEIGPRKITLEELDRYIEKMIDIQLEQVASTMPAEERAKQRESLLRRVSTSEARLSQLRFFIMEEVLTRKAREEKLQDDPAVKDLLGMVERQILASKEMGKELSDKIHITDSDLKNFYEAHKAEYKEKKDKGTARQKTFEEARPEVYSALRRQKEAEIQQELLGRLEQKYDVVIHNDAFGKEKK